MKPEIIPDLDWYQEISRTSGSSPRCPFSALRRCPKYYFSVWVMGKSGAAEIDEETDKDLQKHWENTDLWPIPKDLEPFVGGPENDMHLFFNICPEVSYDLFGYFAKSLSKYADEIDRDVEHKRLSKSNADPNNWKWAWSTITEQHYSECEMYSKLLVGFKELPPPITKNKIGF